jgi:hypothetical protein
MDGDLEAAPVGLGGDLVEPALIEQGLARQPGRPG